ncbi:MAG TPA: peptide transporter [Planctomycetaceae bacterium]|nr:peptide transporter [Planctomycetaceae bacterium]
MSHSDHETHEEGVAPTAHQDPDQVAREWLAKVYQGDSVRQLSLRSVVTGMLIGGVMSISNLYVGLKTGWGLTVTVTSCIIAFALFKFLEAIYPPWRKDHFTILENYTMSSAASAAGYMASAGLVSAIPALTLITGQQLKAWELMAWLTAVSLLGVFMAIPLKRQLINIDQLPFPEGLATAQTLKSMHTAGAEAIQKARALVWAAVLGSLLEMWKSGVGLMKEHWSAAEGWKQALTEKLAPWALPDEFPLSLGLERFLSSRTAAEAGPTLGAVWLKKYMIGIEASFLMIAAGAIMGIRVGSSLLLGAIGYFGILGPWLKSSGILKETESITKWTLWPATALMVASGLLSFALRWKTALRAFSSLTSILGSDSKNQDPLEAIEVPGSWFIAGTLLSGAACVALGAYLFQVEWWMGIIAVLLTFLLSIVAARATGETSITPIGAMGKITQLTFGVLAPSNPTTNLMTASITAGAASHSADLLTDLKAGYMLGGNPRRQTISQFFGVLAGSLFCVPVYLVLVTPEALQAEKFPAPAARVWEGVARLLADGIDKLPKYALAAMIVGAVVGIVLTLLEEFLPRKYRKWIPSPTALGIAGVVPAFNSISMFLGAFLAWIFSKARPATDEKYTVPVASGLIAGESLMGVFIKLGIAGPQLLGELMKLFGGK